MGAGSGFALKSAQWFVRGIQLACAALILAIYSYFLAALHNHKISISTTVRAVEGISGFACLYTVGALLLLCCFAGRTFSSFVALILDVAFIGAFIYVAVANKSGAGSCEGYLDTPFGKGKAGDKADGSDGFTALPSYRVACRLQSACLAVAIIAIIFFVLSILMTVALARHHHREKRFGPSPQNNYTEGYGKSAGVGGFFSNLFRRKTNRTTHPDNVLPEHPIPDAVDLDRPSHGTERTAVEDQQEGVYNKYDTGYGYPLPQGQGRQDGYGHIYYPEPEDHLPATNQTHQTGGAYPQTQTQSSPYNTQNQSGYRYDDGVYDRV